MLHQKRGQTRDTADHHTHTQRPSSSQPLHRWPQEQIRRQLHDTRQKEVQKLVPSKNWSIIRQSNIHTGVCEPNERYYDGFLP